MRRIAGTVLFVLLLSAVNAGAATITAASCSPSAVQAALNQASAGDTVSIPAGTCSWTSGVVWTAPANVTVRGAGDLSIPGGGDATVLVDDYASGSPLISITTNPSGTFRLAGITVRGGTGALKETATLLISGSSKQVRIDHIHLNMQAYSAAALNSKPIRFAGPLNGVVDHNIFDLGGLGWIHIQGDGTGDSAWAAPAGFGGPDFIFLEDNDFNGDEVPNLPGRYFATVSDCNAGGRFVVRYNRIVSASVGQTHPTGGAGRGRGCRAHELYGNVVTPAASFDPRADEPPYAFSFMTSGAMLVWGNSASGVYKNFISLNVVRKSNSPYPQTATPNGWGYCGTSFSGIGSSWDGNTSSTTGYPCLDQPGRGQGQLLSGQFPNAVNTATGTIAWPNQVLEPIREWLNTATIVPGWGGSHLTNGAPGLLSANVDYYLYTSSFNGIAGIGSGTRASRPSSCTPGVAYWSVDQGGNWNTTNSTQNDGTLDLCTSLNTWTNAVYTPFPYPHPFTQTQTGAPPAPTNLIIN
jgi:hypothetical protein